MNGPPNWPNDVPLAWCIERQKRVVGVRGWLHWLVVRGVVLSSARDLKAEIDADRAKFRAMLTPERQAAHPPRNVREALERTNPTFRGWVAESAEGAAAPYPLEAYPESVCALVRRIKTRYQQPPVAPAEPPA